MPKSLRGGALPYLWILASACLLFVGVGQLHPVRVGDGSEYYGLYYAWAVGHRPWMSAAAFDAYGTLFTSGQIGGLVSQQMLTDAFQSLRVGLTADFNHFWFYSLLAFVCAKLTAVLGLTLSPHQAFLVLHAVAIGGTAALAYRYYRWQGVLSVTLLLLCSPMLWFIDKVHTELLTVCLVLASVILMMAQRYLGAALLLALASTQNPSFAILACIPLFYRVVLDRAQRYSFVDVALVLLVVLSVLVHPVYYFSRFGVPTPQMLAGGAAMGENLSTFYVWIVDPDLGLLPNWPLACAVVVVLLAARLSGQRLAPDSAATRRYTVFAVLYLIVNFYAHSSTINMNSGATPGLARYALWYLPLAFPYILRVGALFPWGSRRAYAALPVLLALVVSSVVTNDPRQPERFHIPSLSSNWIQTHLPSLYNPHPEVFVERYSGFGEGFFTRNLRAVIGPDCRKMLILPGGDRHGAVAPASCLFDQAKLDTLINGLPAVPGDRITDARYTRLAERDRAALVRLLMPGSYSLEAQASNDGVTILVDGWSGREQWGVWSDSKQASLMLPCADQVDGVPRALQLGLRLRRFQPQSISIVIAGQVLWRGVIDGSDQPVNLALMPQHCESGRYHLVLDIPGAVSPLELGQGNDGRKLGVGLLGYEVKLQ